MAEKRDLSEQSEGMSGALAGELAEIASALPVAAEPWVALQDLERRVAQVQKAIEAMLQRVEAELAPADVVKVSDMGELVALIDEIAELSTATARLAWAHNFLASAHAELDRKLDAYAHIFAIPPWRWGGTQAPFTYTRPIGEWRERFSRIPQPEDEDCPF